MATQRFDGDVEITGTIRVSGTYEGPINRSNLITDNTAVYPLALHTFRVHNAYSSLLPATAATNNLGLTSGAYGTDVPTIRSEDLNAQGTYTAYARTSFTLPPEYVSGGTITLRIYADTQAGTANVDAQVFQASKTNFQITGSDLVTTSPTALSTVFGAKDFEVTSTSKLAGDTFDIRIAVIGTTSTTALTIARIPNIEILLQVKG